MQKYRLKDFEFSINPNTWSTAQDLVQAGAVRSLRELEKHFWVALVDTPEGAVEVEVMLTPQRVKAYTCECWNGHRKLMCAHIAAALLKIRQFLEQAGEERRQRIESRQKTDPVRLTVQHILNEVPPADLVDFVQEYARRDRDFALALKTWFAGAVTAAANPFALVLESAIPKNTGNSKLRETEFRRLRKTLDDLLGQAQVGLEEQHFRNTFQIATAIMEKTAPLLERYDAARMDPLRHFCRESLDLLRAIPADQASPELQEDIWQARCRWMESPWLPPELRRPLAEQIGEQSSEPGRFESIQAIFDRSTPPIPGPVLYAYVSALAVRNIPGGILKVLESYATGPADVREAIYLLFHQRQWKAARICAEHFLDKGWFKTLAVRELEDLLLRIAEQEKDTTRIRFWLKKRFMDTGNTETFIKWRQNAGSAWPQELASLLADLNEQNDKSRMATVLAAEQEIDALAGLLQQSNDLALLQKFEHLLPDSLLHERYVFLLGNYLQDHFGLPAAAHVRNALAGLLRLGREALILDVFQALVAAFPDRQSLPEELMELFPKNKRRQLLPASPR